MTDERDLLEELNDDVDTHDVAEAVTAIGDALPAVAPSAGLRQRLLDRVDLAGRFDRHITAVAEMLDIELVRAKQLLDSIDKPGVFVPELPGVDFYWVDGGPKTVDCVRGFVRVDQSTTLPEHAHLGKERVLVLQGIYVDQHTGRRLMPGDQLQSEKDTSHGFDVVSGGADLLMLVVVEGGYRIGDLEVLPR